MRPPSEQPKTRKLRNVFDCNFCKDRGWYDYTLRRSTGERVVLMSCPICKNYSGYAAEHQRRWCSPVEPRADRPADVIRVDFVNKRRMGD
jgi:hypothetical protein